MSIIKFQKALVLAPLAGYSNLPYRLLCRRHGADIAVTEMISALSLKYSLTQKKPNQKIQRLMDTRPDDSPLGLQLFGSKPEVLEETIRLLDDSGNLVNYDFIDLNAGCPVPKIVKQGAGGALLKTPAKLRIILERMRKVSPIPVSVKIRIGWETNDLESIMTEIIKAEPDFVTIHFRTVMQKYRDPVKTNLLNRLIDTIPIIANGNFRDPSQISNYFSLYPVKGIMIGRKARTDPTIFQRTKAEMLGTTLSAPTFEDRLEMLDDLFTIARQTGYYSMIFAKRHAYSLLQDFPRSSEARLMISRITELNKLEAYIFGNKEIKESLGEI